MFKRLRLLLVLISILSITLSAAAAPPDSIPWKDKVDPWVLQNATQGPTEFLVYLSAQADLSEAHYLPTKLEKGSYVYRALTSLASRTQKPLIAQLDSLGVKYRLYWIANMIWVRGDLAVIQELAERPDVAHLYANPHVTLDEPISQAASASTPQGVEWNIDWVNAPAMWALGYTGQGTVIGGQDTGYVWDHPALKDAYRGWDGFTVDHDYNWFDATAEHSPVPIDPYGHGTHTMGIMVGDDGNGNQVGMAPGARWIGCRNMDVSGIGSPETYAACYQWFVAPTRVDGTDPRPDLSPDVINNSWSCPESEGCTDPLVLQTVVHNLVAAGIVTAHSAGNSGYLGCGSIDTPAAIYAESFTVGATGYLTDTIATFSSLGPVTVDGSYRPKPDISAPGVSVRSASRDGGYVTMTGTSMAAPHVAGLVALLISAYPDSRGYVDRIEHTIEQSALHIPWAGCDSSGVPNNAYGWGRIDALSAFENAQPQLILQKLASEFVIRAGDLLTYTLTITQAAGISPVTNVVLTDTLPIGSTFITATLPYSRSGDTLRWDFPSLEPSGAKNVELVVRSEITATGALINADYGTYADQILPIRGAPVTTLIKMPYFLPVLFSSSLP